MLYPVDIRSLAPIPLVINFLPSFFKISRDDSPDSAYYLITITSKKFVEQTATIALATEAFITLKFSF